MEPDSKHEGAFADLRSPSTLLPPSQASDRLASGTMPINAHAKARRIERYIEGQSSKAPEYETGPPRLKIHPRMLEILPETYGVMVYQEDVLRVAHELAGMTYAEADILRRAISGKMRSNEAMEQIRDRFLSGTIARGLPEPDAHEIWRQMASFAGYSFCKGHSAAFAVLSYQVAYLKAHHPAEFLAGVLSNHGGFYGPGAYLEEARRWGIRILSPCINNSIENYTGFTSDAALARRTAGLEDPAYPEQLPPDSHAGWLRIGFTALKGLTGRSMERMVRSREKHGSFTSLRDLKDRTGIGLEECRLLIRAGALNCFASSPFETSTATRRLKLQQRLLMDAECLYKAADAGLEHGFFNLDFPEWQAPAYAPLAGAAPVVMETPPGGNGSTEAEALRVLVNDEVDVMGFMISSHPIEMVKLPPDLVKAKDIRSYRDQKIAMAGWLISAKLLATKTNGKTMKMLTLEDRSGVFEAVLFPRVYERFATRTLGRGPFLVEGPVDMSLGSPSLNVQRIRVLV